MDTGEDVRGEDPTSRRRCTGGELGELGEWSAEADGWDPSGVDLLVHEHGEVVRGVLVGVDVQGELEGGPGAAQVVAAPVDPRDEGPEAGGVPAGGRVCDPGVGS